MDAAKRDRITFVSVAILLVVRFIGRLTPDSEMPSPTLSMMTLVLDLALITSLVGLAPRVLRGLPANSFRGGWIFLLIAGAGAGLGIFAIRLSGGPQAVLPPRKTAVSDAAKTIPKSEVPIKEMQDLMTSLKKVPKGPPSDSEVMSQHLHELIAAWVKASDKFEKRPSVKGKQADRGELHEIRGELAETRGYVDQILKVCTEAEAKRLDISSAWNEKALTGPEYWRGMKQTLDAADARMSLAEQHYEEWKTENESRADRDLKPWQREMRRQEELANAGVKEMREALAAAEVTPTPPGIMDFANLIQTKEKLHSELAAYRETLARYNQTRWAQSASDKVYQPQKITSADLHQCSEVLPLLLASMDRLIAAFDSSHSILRFEEKEYWHVRREICSLTAQQIKVLETNWKEWHLSGIKVAAGEAKPWQKEASRLQEEIDKQERMLVLHRSQNSTLLE